MVLEEAPANQGGNNSRIVVNKTQQVGHFICRLQRIVGLLLLVASSGGCRLAGGALIVLNSTGEFLFDVTTNLVEALLDKYNPRCMSDSEISMDFMILLWCIETSSTATVV
eukprot:scaffold1943_cov160-Amphora_coffeaeformis.AAC.2